MSYRQSRFDPAAGAPPQVIRPYDRWQNLGLGLEIFAVTLFVVGMFDPFGELEQVGLFGLFLAGLGLVHWREADLPPNQLGRRKWVLAFAAMSLLAFLHTNRGLIGSLLP